MLYKLKNGEIKLKDFPLKEFILAFVLSTIIIYLYKSIYLGTIKFSIKKIFNGWLFLIFYIGYFFPKDKDKIIKLMLFSAIIAGIWGIFNFFMHGDFAKGFYSHALTAANNWALILIVCYFFIFNSKEKLYYLITFIIIFSALICSMERGPIVYFSLTLIIMNILIFKSKKGIAVSLILLIFILISIFSSKNLSYRFKIIFSKNSKNNESVNVRIELWKQALKIIKKHPLTGCPEKFKNYMKKVTTNKNLIRSHPHNGFLTILVKYGFIPFFFFILLFGKILKDMMNNLKKNKIAILGLCFTILYLMEGLTENNFGDSEVKMLFWFLLGIVYSYLNKNHLKLNNV